MLRTLLAALVVANLLFFAFTRGWFDGVGLHSLGDREPDRLSAQVRPEAIRLLPMAAAASAPTEASACYEAGPFTSTESSAFESTLKATLPAGSWVDNRSESAGPAGAVVVSHTFRVGAADAALGARLVTLRLDPAGRSFTPCKNDRR